MIIFISRIGLEEGDICNRNLCSGKIIIDDYVDEYSYCCSCHTGNPPCSWCTTDKRVCNTCGWRPDEDEYEFEFDIFKY